MLNQYFQDLENSIKWAEFDQGTDILMLARDNMEKLIDFAEAYPSAQKQKILNDVDAMLPMEWVFWMEICRSEDLGLFSTEPKAIH